MIGLVHGGDRVHSEKVSYRNRKSENFQSKEKMKTKFIKSVFVVAIAMVSSINVFNAQKSVQLSEIALANVEALADSESNKMDFWCCGNTGDCAIGDDLVIHGKLSQKPC